MASNFLNLLQNLHILTLCPPFLHGRFPMHKCASQVEGTIKTANPHHPSNHSNLGCACLAREKGNRQGKLVKHSFCPPRGTLQRRLQFSKDKARRPNSPHAAQGLHRNKHQGERLEGKGTIKGESILCFPYFQLQESPLFTWA
jgi:hypothetical protein